MNSRLFTVPVELIKEFGTNDPFVIAQGLRKFNGKPIRIETSFVATKKQKGFCTRILNNYFIFVSQNLSEQMQRMVCGHELGHVLFHQDRLGYDRQGKPQSLVEWELFDIKDNTEYEANLFAANLLIDTDELKDMIYQGYDIVSIASAMNVNVNMMAIKIAETKFDDVTVPFIPKMNFLGRIDDSAGSI